jgi:hypothetical protein
VEIAFYFISGFYTWLYFGGLLHPAAFAAYCSSVACCSSLAAHGSTLGACCSSPPACCCTEVELLCIEN